MSTYAILKADVADWLLRDDLTNAIPSFVRLAEANIRRDVRVRAQETAATLTITSGTASLPTGFIQARRLTLNSTADYVLDYLAPDVMYSSEIYNETGSAIAYTIEGDSLIFRPATTEDALMLYIKAFDALSSESDTNWLLTNAYDVYLYGTLVQAAPYIKDDARLTLWETMYAKAVFAVNKMDNLGRISGSALKSLGNVPK